jgi:chaperonin GroEL (HSP60 family)
MSEMSDGGIFLPDGATIDEVLAPRDDVVCAAIPETVAGERFAVRRCSPMFVTDPTTWLAELDRAAVLVLAQPAERGALLPILEAAAQAGRAILIAAPAFETDALGTLVVNKLRGVLYTCAVEAPPLTLAAIATATGCPEPGDVATALDRLGRARRVLVSEDTAVIDVR